MNEPRGCPTPTAPRVRGRRRLRAEQPPGMEAFVLTPETEAEIVQRFVQRHAEWCLTPGDDERFEVCEAQSCRDKRALLAELQVLRQERDEARQWVRDLHSGMWINCVYCGHRYGPAETTPQTVGQAGPSMAEILTSHIASCPKHPLSKALEERDAERQKATLAVLMTVAMVETLAEGAAVPMFAAGVRMACEEITERVCAENADVRAVLAAAKRPRAS